MTKAEVIRKIYKEIDNLPPIPENIAKIQQLIHDPKSDIGAIAQYVKKDVGLTANILRISNSPWYMPVMRVDTVDRAITMIGLRRLYSIIMAIGAKKVIDERVKNVRDAWKHSYKCAFYTQNLMKLQKADSEMIELGYIAGLLHDMGKVVFLSLSPELVKKMTDLSEAKKISVAEIEKTALGLSHSEVGGKIAAKWKFPEQIIDAITFHHDPQLAKEKSNLYVCSVYLANILCKLNQYEAGLIEKLNPTALGKLKITTDKQLEAITHSLIESYAIAPDIQFF